MDTVWIVLICIAVYIVAAFPIAVFVGRRLHKMAQYYPAVNPDEE